MAPYDGSGNYVRVTDWTDDRDAGIKIMADRHDSQDDDFAAALTNAITRDGQSQITADIPFNGHKITGLAAPTNNTDAATKAYADAVRNFNTSLTISGNDAQGRVNFTGTGTVGLSFTAADLGFGVRTGDEIASHHRFVWNGAPDFSGTDGMVLTDDAQLGIGQVPPFSAVSGVYARMYTADQNYALNCYYSNADSKWHFLTAGWAFMISGVKANGTAAIYRSSATGEADAVITWESIQSWAANKNVTFPSSVLSGAAVFQTNADLNGSVWTSWGSASAFTAISARIESRGQAWANTKLAYIRLTSETFVDATGGSGGPKQDPGAPWIATAIQKIGSDNMRLFFRALQYVDGNGNVTNIATA
jgi:hypothetical protein